MAGRVLTNTELNDIRRALDGESGGRSMSRPDTVMRDLLATIDSYRNCPQCGTYRYHRHEGESA